MSSIDTIRNYKHDISGKFKDISTALASMNENSFNDPTNNEIFHAIHEVLLRMVKTSRNTMIENLKQEMVLVVSDQEPDTSLHKLHIEGVTVRCEMGTKEVKYFYFKSENDGDAKENLEVLKKLLPIKMITFESHLGLDIKSLKDEKAVLS